jgi:hypothetical protein
MRYKSKTWRNFSLGIGQLNAKIPGMFYTGKDFDIDQNGKPLISKKYLSQSLSNTGSFYEEPLNLKNLIGHNGNYFFVCNNTVVGEGDYSIQKASSPASDFSQIAEFSSPFEYEDLIISLASFDDKLIFFAYDSTILSAVAHYSTDNGLNWSSVDLTSLIGEYVFGHVVVNDKLYIISKKGIYYTTDGINYSEYLEFSEEKGKIYNFFHLDGFFYFYEILGTNNIYRVGPNKSVDLIFSNSSERIDCAPLEDTFFVVDTRSDKLVFHKYDNISLKKFVEIDLYQDFMKTDETPFIKFLGEHDSKLYYDLTVIYFIENDGFKNASYIFSIDKNGVIKAEFDFTSELLANNNENTFFQLFSYGYGFYLFTQDDNVLIYKIQDGIYYDSCYIETSVSQMPDSVPKQLRLFHNPMPDGAKIEVYEKQDFASSWTKILTSDTANAIKKVYDYPKGSNFDYIQYKIMIYSNVANDDFAKNANLELLYLPKGLSRAL